MTDQTRHERIDNFLRSNQELQDKLADVLWTLNFRKIYETVRDIDVHLSRPLLQDLLNDEFPSTLSEPKKRVVDIVLRDAVSKGDVCPITLDPITLIGSVCVAPCYHVFQKDAIQTHLKTSKLCPQCREPCTLG